MDRFAAMKVFSEVAAQGSFAGAGRVLNLAPPSVSRIIGDLEADMGLRLFTRTTRAVALTEEGATFLERALPILEEIQAISDEMQARRESPGGTLRITSVLSFGSEVVTPAAARFAAQYPDLRLDIDLTNRKVDIVNEHLDLAIRIGGIGGLDDTSLKARKLYRQHLIFVATPELAARIGPLATINDLENVPFMNQVSGTWGARHRFDIGGQSEVRALPGGLVVNNPIAARAAVREGAVMGLLGDYLVRDDLDAGRLVRLLPEVRTAGDDIFAVFPHRSFMPAKTRLFIDFLAADVARWAKAVGRHVEIRAQ